MQQHEADDAIELAPVHGYNSRRADDDGSSNPFLSTDDPPDQVRDGRKAKTGSIAVRAMSPTSIASGRDSRASRYNLRGWRFGVACSAAMASGVLLLNIVLTAWAWVHFGPTVQGGLGTAYEGDCVTVATWSTALHLAINILSSLMLSASNYTMQCLNAATRTEIDRAHEKGDWLDVGVASIRNLSRIRSQRVWLWWLLALSSLPIHLLYNSAVFKQLGANNYQGVVVTPAFFEPNLNVSAYVNFNLTNYTTYSWSGKPEGYDSVPALQLNASTNGNYGNASLYEKLSNVDCLNAYDTSYVNGRTNVFVVTEPDPDRPNRTWFDTWISFVPTLYDHELPQDWLCAQDVASCKRDPSNWTYSSWDLFDGSNRS